MSDLQNDKLVVGERKNKIKDQDASLTDQIPSRLFSKLQELNFGHKIREAWSTGSSERTHKLRRDQEYLSGWDEFLVNESEGPFEGSSNLHIPMTFTVCKAYHARIMQALTSDDFSYTTKARREDYVDREELVRETMRYYLKEAINYGKGIAPTLDTWVWDWITTGMGLKKWRWERSFERFEDVEEQIEETSPTYRTNKETGEEELVPRFKMVEREVTKTVETSNCPYVETVALEDLLWKGHPDPNSADITIHRQWLTASELWSYVDQKIFNSEAVDKVIKGGPSSKFGTVGGQIKSQRALNEAGAITDSTIDLARYEILEAYTKLDVFSSGINSEIVGWVDAKTGELLRGTYLRRISKKGKRPFVRADFIRTSHHEFSKGLPEVLHPLQVELDALRNMRVDWGILSVMPFFFYRSTSLTKEDLNIQPGAGIPVDNPQTDVYFPNLGNRTFFGTQEEQAITTLVERLTGFNDINYGSVSGQQGVTRTASGVRALVNESNINLNVHLRRLNEGWKTSLQILFYMLQQRIPEGLSFRVTGLDGGDYFTQIKHKDAFYGDYDFEISPNSETSNTSVRLDTATQIVQAITNPLMIQLGVVGPQEIYTAQKNYFQALGVKDYSRYLIKPQQWRQTLLPQEEFNRVIRGMEVPVTPEMDHQGYLDYYMHVMNTPQLLGQFSEEATLMIASQAQKHSQMMQALEAQAAQLRNQQQMTTNANYGQMQGGSQAIMPQMSAGEAPVAPEAPQ